MSLQFAYIGTYTGNGQRGEGIMLCRFHPAEGTFEKLKSFETLSPSFLCLSRDRKTLFAVNEHWKDGEVSSFQVDPDTGEFQFLSKQSTQGGSPCHLCTDPSGKWLFVANHNDGSLTMHSIDETGKLNEATQRIQHEGKNPHAHWVGFDPTGQFLLCVDKGIDKVMVYRISGGKLVPHDPPFASLKPGTAPRHLAFHPNGHFAYVNGEADMSVTTFAYDGERGSFQEIQRQFTLPESEIEKNFTTSEIAVHPTGKLLFVSNRVHDSIAMFAIEGSSGKLERTAVVPSGGKNPRHFTLDPTGKWLFVAHQDSDSIVRIEIDGQHLRSSVEVMRTGSPVCLLITSIGDPLG